jgi:hypothetical protein
LRAAGVSDPGYNYFLRGLGGDAGSAEPLPAVLGAAWESVAVSKLL